MLRVEPFTVSLVRPTCSMYLRQLCRLAARAAGTRYIQIKYFQSPNIATAPTTRLQNTTRSTSSAQILRRTRWLRTTGGEVKKARRKTNGENSSPRFSSQKAATQRIQRGMSGLERGQNS